MMTTSDLATPSLAYRERSNRRWRWGSRAFLVAVAIQGLPFGRDLVVSEQQFAEQRHWAALEGATTLGLQNTIVLAVIWSALYLVAAIAIYRYGQRTFLGALRRQWPLALLTALVPTSVLWAVHAQPVVMNTIHAIGVTLVAFAASMYYWDKQHALVRHLALVLGLNLVIQMGSIVLLPSLTITYDGRWSGLTGNANTLGALAGLAVWASVAAAVVSEGRVRWVYGGIFVCAAVALYGTNSITATLSSSIAAAGMVWLVRFPSAVRHSAVLALVLAPLVFLAAWGGILAVLEGFLPTLGRTADLSGRTGIWADAIRLIELHPFLGWGFDNNARVIEQTGLSTLHFHNGYLDLAVRGGILALGLLLSVVYRVMRHLRRKPTVASAIGLSFLFLVLVYNVTEVTFLAPRSPLWIVLLCVVFSAIPRMSRLIR